MKILIGLYCQEKLIIFSLKSKFYEQVVMDIAYLVKVNSNAFQMFTTNSNSKGFLRRLFPSPIKKRGVKHSLRNIIEQTSIVLLQVYHVINK